MATPATITTTKTVNISSYYSGSTYDSANIDSSYPISNGYAGSDSTTYAKIPLTQGSNAETSFIYSFASLSSIPSTATINSVSCSAKLGINQTGSKYVSSRTVQLCTGSSGSTLMGSASTVGSGSSVYTLTTGTWTRSQLTSAKLRLYAKRGTSGTSTVYYFVFYGATLTVNYTFEGYNYDVTVDSMPINIGDGILATPTTQSIQQGSDSSSINITNPWGHNLTLKDNGVVAGTFTDTTKTYTITNVQRDHNITIEYTPSIVVKENNKWDLIGTKIYKKVAGDWQEQSISSAGIISNHYYNALGNTLFDNAPSLMKMFANLDVVTSCGLDGNSYYLPNGFHCAISKANLYANQTFGYATAYVGDLVPGEHYYVLLVSSGAHYNTYATNCVMGFFEIVYTNSTNITINKLFGRDNDSVTLGLEIDDRTIAYTTCKCLIPYSLYNNTKDYMFSVASMLFFKKSKDCKYSYAELNNMATDDDIFGVKSYRGSDEVALYAFNALSPLSTSHSNEWGGSIKNKKGYLWFFYRSYYSLSYIDTTNTDYIYCYPIKGNYPDNITLLYPNTSLRYEYNFDMVDNVYTGRSFLEYLDSTIYGYGNFGFLIEDT